MKTKTIIWIVLAVIVLSMFGCAPGSEQWNIQRAAMRCIQNGGLQAGEKLVFINGTQRQNACEWNGQACMYVAVKYAIAQHELKLDISTYEMLQKLSVTLTEKTPLRELFAKPKISNVKDQFDPNGQLLLDF